jgi:hypothetical protein
MVNAAVEVRSPHGPPNPAQMTGGASLVVVSGAVLAQNEELRRKVEIGIVTWGVENPKRMTCVAETKLATGTSAIVVGTTDTGRGRNTRGEEKETVGTRDDHHRQEVEEMGTPKGKKFAVTRPDEESRHLRAVKQHQQEGVLQEKKDQKRFVLCSTRNLGDITMSFLMARRLGTKPLYRALGDLILCYQMEQHHGLIQTNNRLNLPLNLPLSLLQEPQVHSLHPLL